MYEVATQQSGEMVSRNTQTEMMISRQAQEVQGAMVIAKRFPRDEVESFNRIMQSCKRKSLAESAMYEYPRGGTKVSGPSIRLAEAMAQNWGNIDFGITELEQKNGESQVMAYAWDLETNTRQVKIFSVPHVRGTKKGNVPLTDPRDNTIVKYRSDGVRQDIYDSRAKQQSVFDLIAPGNIRVVWPGSFGFDLKLYCERSEPKCKTKGS